MGLQRVRYGLVIEQQQQHIGKNSVYYDRSYIEEV